MIIRHYENASKNAITKAQQFSDADHANVPDTSMQLRTNRDKNSISSCALDASICWSNKTALFVYCVI